MSDLPSAFDATTVEPNQPFEVIPAGKYPVQIVASEMRPTKDGNGQYLWLELEILDGEYKGRKLWDRLNLVNSNTQAVEIAQRTLSAICHAIGELQVRNTEQLHFKPMIASVRVRPKRMVDGQEYDASNEVRGYEAASGARPAPAAAQAKPAAPTAAAAPAAKSPPWRSAKAS